MWHGGSVDSVRAKVTRIIGLLLAIASLDMCAPVHRPAASTQGRPQDTNTSSPARSSLFRYPWVWTDEQGKSVTFADWRGEPLVVAVFYTSCRRTCPQTLRTLRTIHTTFTRENPAAHFLLVTLDPTTHTPETLREFKNTEDLPVSWHLLMGSVDQTRDFTDLLDIHVMDLDEHFVHETKIVLFDARGMLLRTLRGSDGDTSSL